MRSDYAEHYRELYERHWWWRARERFILETIRSEQPLQGWKRILDIGCGDGLFFGPLSQFGEVEGVESSEALVNSAGPYRSRIHTVPFDDNFQPGKTFSLILMLDVLEHLADPAGALRHALRILDPAGRILITVPAFKLLWTNHDILNHHLTRYTKANFRELARRTGLEIDVAKYFFHWAFPVKLVLHFAEAALRPQPKPPAVPAAWINVFLYQLSRCEQRSWGALPLPFGSSLLVLGHKSRAGNS